MTTESAAVSLPGTHLRSFTLPARSWQRWLSFAISAALLTATIYQFDRLGRTALWSALPSSPIFWIAFASYYLALPVSEWIIFRRLWRLPAAGFGALLRKLVSNELLVGYSGELVFYTWARRRANLTATPFAAIKDVSIASAITGNFVTLAMVAVAWRSLAMLHLGADAQELNLSAGVLVLIAGVFFVLKQRLFSLPARDLRFIFLMHFLRVAGTTFLSGVLWHSALPDVALSLWVLLAALQLLVTRLPFVPNKDLIFAGLAFFVVGQTSPIAALITLIAGLILLTHVIIGGALAMIGMFELADDQ